MTGVTFVVPVHRPGALLDAALTAMLARGREADLPFEILLVSDDRDAGAMSQLLATTAAPAVRCLPVEREGAAAALNTGLAHARFDLVAQVDQDVVLHEGWLITLLAKLDADDVAAVQGQYVTDARGTLVQRLMSRDLEDRYSALAEETDHVCTGNVLYRRSAVRRVGGFDPQLGYGYDNDISYRLVEAGYRLRFCATAQSHHQWRDTLGGYLQQQYGFGYGRLDLVAKHRGRFTGDAVSPALMMFHPVALTCACIAAVAGVLAGGDVARLCLWLAAGLGGALVLERLVAGMRAARRTRDWVPLLFPLVHLLRDAAWVWAIVVWTSRRALGRTAHPGHSMKPRRVDREPAS